MFLFGIFLGIILTIVTIFITLFIIGKKQKKIIDKDEFTKVNVDNKLIEELINNKKEAIIKNKTIGLSSNFEKIKISVTDIADEIPKFYFPESKYPKYELTIEETLLLNIHISERLLEQLQRKRFKLLRELRISQILYMNDLKKNILDKEFIKKINKYKVVDIIKNGWMVYNAVNPLYWIRKVAITGGIEATLRGFGVTIINVVGEEISNVYSKSFKEAKEHFDETKKLEHKK